MSRKIILLLLMIFALAACDTSDTGDRDTDTEAAQSFFPTIAGYSSQETDNVQDAVVTALGGASLLSGNVAQAALVDRLDTLLDCYRERGALDARIYLENITNLTEARVPVAGVLAVINQDRIRDNFASCITRPPGLFSAQSATPEPCTGTGQFTAEGDTILYVYAASDTPLCQRFQAYFDGLSTP